MKKEKFIAKVQKELDRIKERATPEEISRLKFKNFKPDDGDHCVYGLMTGNCNSDRAKEIQKKTLPSVGYSTSSYFIESDFYKADDYTALERYLFLVGSEKHKEILKYLKGKIQTIDLNVI